MNVACGKSDIVQKTTFLLLLDSSLNELLFLHSFWTRCVSKTITFKFLFFLLLLLNYLVEYILIQLF